MGRFVLGRTLQALGSLFIVTVVIFLLARLTGDPAQLLIPDEWTREQANALRAHLGLDKPLVVQYWIYLTGLFRGDLGTSTWPAFRSANSSCNGCRRRWSWGLLRSCWLRS